MRVSAAEIDAAESLRAGNARGARKCRRPHCRLSRAAKAEDSRFTDAVGVERAIAGRRSMRRVFMFGRAGKLSFFRADERHSARVAGVARVAMVVPAPGGYKPLVLAAAKYAGVNEIFRIGGAQAIAALAYGTATVAPVDVIVGPGNAYVQRPKTGIRAGRYRHDGRAVRDFVVADADNDPAWIAADLMSQAEHDDVAQSVLICDSAEFAEAVIAAVIALLDDLPRAILPAAVGKISARSLLLKM